MPRRIGLLSVLRRCFTSLYGFCGWSLFIYIVLSVLSSCAIILMCSRELVAFLEFSSWCLVTVGVLWLFLAVPLVGLQCVIVVFHDHTHLLFIYFSIESIQEILLFLPMPFLFLCNMFMPGVIVALLLDWPLSLLLLFFPIMSLNSASLVNAG